MNGLVFDGLTNLMTLKLERNLCIDENFLDLESISQISQIVTRKCSIISERNSENAIIQTKDLEFCHQDQSNTKLALNSKISNLESKILVFEAEQLKEKKEVESTNSAFESLRTMKEFYQNQNALQNQTFADMQNLIKIKVNLIETLFTELQAKKAELLSQSKKIDLLTKKMTVLSGNCGEGGQPDENKED